MSSPIVIHMYRPYASEEEYLAHERYSIEAKSMILIDQPALPVDTAVVFDVTLENGQKPIRAEARVVGYAEAEPERGRLGGVRVRFRRFGAATKAFIDRAVNGSVSTLATPSLAPDAGEAAVVSVAATNLQPPPEPSDVSDANEASGIHKKAISPVAAPVNREALLARLRGRRVG